MQTITIDPLTEFFDAIQSPLTKDRYEKRLALFFKHIQIEGSSLTERANTFTKKALEDFSWATLVINDYMRYQKSRAEKKEIAESTVSNYFKPIKLFCEMNDITLNWKKISRRIPRGRSYGQDRAPSVAEIKQLLSYPDRRIKPAILTMLSSGIRVGAFDYLDWGNIEKVEKDGQLLASKILVYAGTPDEYRSFITPECYRSIEDYLKFRENQGEKIDKNSPIIRNLFHPDKLGKGEPHLPKRLKNTGVKRIVEDALKGTGIRGKLEPGKRRHEFQADHGFRKFFKSICERHMKSLHTEMLMGHDTGLAQNYYRPSEQEILQDYLRAVPDLTMLEQIKFIQPDKLEKLEKENITLRSELDGIKEQLKLLTEMVSKKKK